MKQISESVALCAQDFSFCELKSADNGDLVCIKITCVQHLIKSTKHFTQCISDHPLASVCECCRFTILGVITNLINTVLAGSNRKEEEEEQNSQKDSFSISFVPYKLEVHCCCRRGCGMVYNLICCCCFLFTVSCTAGFLA